MQFSIFMPIEFKSVILFLIMLAFIFCTSLEVYKIRIVELAVLFKQLILLVVL